VLPAGAASSALSAASGFAQFQGRLLEWTEKFSLEAAAACGALLGMFK